jgi:hypothetical protein
VKWGDCLVRSPWQLPSNTPELVQDPQNGATECPPHEGGQRERSSRSGSITSHVGPAWARDETLRPARPPAWRFAPRLSPSVRGTIKPKTALPKLHRQISSFSQTRSRRSYPTMNFRLPSTHRHSFSTHLNSSLHLPAHFRFLRNTLSKTSVNMWLAWSPGDCKVVFLITIAFNPSLGVGRWAKCIGLTIQSSTVL